MWHMRIYLNDCGWDGEPAFVNFKDEADARQAMAELESLWEEGVPERFRDVHDLELGVAQNDAPVANLLTWAQGMFEELRDEVASYENGPWWTGDDDSGSTS